MEFNFKPKAWFTAFVLFGLLFLGLFLAFDGFIFADAKSFPDSNNAGMRNYAPAEDFLCSDGDGVSEILCYLGTSQSNSTNVKVRIPEKSGIHTITSIGELAFSYDDTNKRVYPVREEIVGIIVPDTISNIGQNVFQLMPKLEWLIINSNDSVQIANNFLGSSETLPPKLAKIYLPQISKTKNVLDGKTLPNGIEVLYSEDCYSTKIYQDENSQGTLSDKNLSLDQITKKGDFILENLGVFKNKIGFEITGEGSDVFSLIVDDIPLTNERLNLDVGEQQRIVLQIGDTASKNVSDARLKIIDMNYNDSVDGNTDVIEEFILNVQEDFEWPSASENLIYNGTSQSLINEDSIVIPSGCKLQFSFDQINWTDLTENSLPEKTDAGNYIVYLKLVNTGGQTIDATNLNGQIAQKPLTVRERTDSLVEKVYDGKKNIPLSQENFILQGLEAVDEGSVELDLTNVSGTVSTANVTEGNNPRQITLSGQFDLTGTKANNYVLSDFDFSKRKLKVNITKKLLNITGDIKLPAKLYDGEKDIPFNQDEITISADGVCTDDTGKLDNIKFVFEDFVVLAENADAGTQIANAVAGQVSLNAAAGDGKNYVLNKTSASEIFNDLTVEIYKRKVKLDGKVKVIDREYDGTSENLIIDGADITVIGAENPEIGIVEGDEVELDTSSLQAILNGTNGSAGENKPVKITGRASLTGASAGNYELSNDFDRDSTVNITPKKLAIVGDLTAKNKVYDGNGNIELTTENLTLDGVISGDNVGLDVGNLVGNTDKNAGTGRSVTVTGQPVLTNNETGNYILQERDFNNLTVEIYKRKVKLDGKVKVIDREYDGTSENLIIDGADITVIGAENPEIGIVEGDEVELDTSSLQATLNGTNGSAGENKPVKITGRASLTGASAGNYELNNDFDRDSTVNITPKKLVIVGDLTAKNKVYDGNGNIELTTENLTLDGVISGDNVGLDVGNLVGNTDKNAGTGKSVTVTGQPVLTNNEAGNYILQERDFNNVTVEIYKRKVKLDGKVRFEDKEYDGKEQVDTQKSGLEIISGEEDRTAIVDGDDIGISYENLKGYLDHENENVGSDKAVRIEGNVYLTGDSVANYELDDNFDHGSTVNIISRKVMISGSGTVTVLSREYNGLKNVELDTSDLNEKLKVVHVGDSEIGIIKQDDVSLDFSKLVGEMEDKNAGENKIVNISGNIVLVGSHKDNYELVNSESDPFNKTATVLITKKELIIKGDISAINKIYDKNNFIELVKSELILDGKIDGDDININFDVIKGNVEDPKAGQNKKVIVNFDGALISGADLINYEFGNPEFDSVFVDITPKEIGLNGDFELEDKKYDGTNDIKFKADSIKLNTEEIYEGDEVELKSKNLSAKSENANVGQKNVTVSGEWFLVGNDAESYVLKAEDINRILNEKIVNITPLPAEFAWSDKTEFDYDGNIHKVTAIVKNRKAPNDTFDLKYDNNTAGNSGSYVAKVIALGNENYTLENAINAMKKWSIRDVFHGGGGGGGFSSGSSSSSSGSNIANNINTNVLSPSIGGMNGFMTSGKTLKDIVVPNIVKQRKYVKGYPDKTFRPNGNMTRAEFAQAIYNLINNNEPVNINVLDKFNDVDKKAWYAKAMAYLSEKNIIKGYDGKIRPNDFVTRGELAQILFDALKSYDNTGTNNYVYGNYDSSFVDLDNNYWAAVAIRQLASNGMVNGYENKTFRAKANITRAEVVAMISKVFGRSFDLNVTREYIDVEKNHWAYNYILDASE